MSNEVAKTQDSNIARIGVEEMIMKGMDKGLSVDVLERLLDMRDRINAEAAKQAYYAALGQFQASCPPISKTRKVKDKNGAVRYSYATLDDIVKQVSDKLQENGLSYTIKTIQKDGFIEATCEVHHNSGHTESSTFPVPIATEGFMNDAQKAGSAMTYAKRYAFCNAFGIMTSDQDDDGIATGEQLSPQIIYRRATEHMNAIREYWDSVGAIRLNLATDRIDEAAGAWTELPEEVRRTLWVATTKGGIFTTKEREFMRSTQFRDACTQFGGGDETSSEEDVP